MSWCRAFGLGRAGSLWASLVHARCAPACKPYSAGLEFKRLGDAKYSPSFLNLSATLGGRACSQIRDHFPTQQVFKDGQPMKVAWYSVVGVLLGLVCACVCISICLAQGKNNSVPCSDVTRQLASAWLIWIQLIRCFHIHTYIIYIYIYMYVCIYVFIQ